MRLKKTYAKREEIPEGAEALYTQKNGVWTRRNDLVLEIDDPKEDEDEDSDKGSRRNRDLDEFRETNKKLLKQNNDLQAELGRFKKMIEGVDPDQLKKYRESLAKQRDEEDRQLLEQGKIDEVVQRKTKRLLEERDAEIAKRTTAYNEMEARYKTASQKLAQQAARRQLMGMLTGKQLRIRPNAEEDLDRAILADWTADESGQLKLMNEALTGRDGGPMSPAEYVEKELVTKRSYFFEPAKGGGAGGTGENEQRRAGGGGGKVVARDPLAFGRNAKAIADGEMQVAPRTSGPGSDG